LYIGAANSDIVQPCSGTPTPGNIAIASSTVCSGAAAGTSITAAGYSTGVTGLSFQWEESDDDGMTDTWANVSGGSGATTATFTTPVLTTSRYYRLRVTCNEGGLSDVTNSRLINVVLCSYDVNRATGITYASIIPTGTAMTWH